MTDIEINNLFIQGYSIQQIVPRYIAAIKVNTDLPIVTQKEARSVIERAIYRLGGGWLKARGYHDGKSI